MKEKNAVLRTERNENCLEKRKKSRAVLKRKKLGLFLWPGLSIRVAEEKLIKHVLCTIFLL